MPSSLRSGTAEASGVAVSPISFCEIGQKVRLGKWPEMADHVAALPRLLADQGGVAAALTGENALAAATMNWPHRDPFDRLIAATAAASGFVLLSADPVFDQPIPTALGVRRLW